jgi:hypothetical protein
MTTKYVVVLALPAGNERDEVWRPCGELEVPMGTKRATIIERVLDGQVDDESAVVTGVPQLSLEDGDAGELLLIPSADVGERLPVRARRRFVVEPMALAQSVTA